MANALAFRGPDVVAPKIYPELEMSQGSAAVDVVIAVGLFLAMLLSPQFVAMMHRLADRFPEYGMLWSNVIIGAASIGIVAAILICRRQGPSTLGLTRFRMSTLIGAVAAVPGCYAAMMGTGLLYVFYLFAFTDKGFDSVLADKQALIDVIPAFSLTTMLLFGVLTGFHEELLFRGLLLTRCNAIVRNRVVAVVVSAALFGSVHAYQGPMGVMQTAAIGLVLGTITTLTRSLWPAIIGHAAFNSMQLAMLPLLRTFLENAPIQTTTMPAG